MRKMMAAALAGAFWAVGSQAGAVNLTYDIFANCNGTCANAGLSQGALIFGTLTLERDSIVIGGTFDETNLVDFSLTYAPGRTITPATSVGASLVGVWANDFDTVAALDLRASTALAPNTGVGLVLMLGSSILSTAANCPTAACDVVNWTSAATLNQVSLRSLGAPAPVPLSPAFAFAVVGAGALFVASRRRRGEAGKP